MAKPSEPPKSTGKSGRGGARPGAGRPKKIVAELFEPPRLLDLPHPGEIPWDSIIRAARAGVDERRIMGAFRLDEDRLRELGALDRFRDEVRSGNDYKEASLRVEIDERGKRSRRNAGSVNILQLEARNVLKWDRQQKAQERIPDLSSAKERLRATLDKLAEQRTEIEGLTVTPAMVLYREVYGAWPDDLAAMAATGIMPVDPLVTPGAGR